MFLQTGLPLLGYIQNVWQCEGHCISDSGVISGAAEALSWSKYSAVLKKMRAHFHPQRCVYIWCCGSGSFLANILLCFLSGIEGFCSVLAHSDTSKLKQFAAPVRQHKRSWFTQKYETLTRRPVDTSPDRK